MTPRHKSSKKKCCHVSITFKKDLVVVIWLTFTAGKALKIIPVLTINRMLNFHFFQIKIPPSKLESMLSHLEQGYSYNGNPYHNNLHACDVLQTTHYFISQTGLAVSLFQVILFFKKKWPCSKRNHVESHSFFCNVIHVPCSTLSSFCLLWTFQKTSKVSSNC